MYASIVKVMAALECRVSLGLLVHRAKVPDGTAAGRSIVRGAGLHRLDARSGGGSRRGLSASERPLSYDPSVEPASRAVTTGPPVATATPDAFPTGELIALIGRLRAYPVLAYRLASDPRIPAARRAAVLGAAGYMVSPIDLVPGFIPLVGQLDDIAVALVAIHVALRGLDEESQREHLQAVGLDAEVLDRDLATVQAASAWLLRRGIRVGVATARVGARVAVAGARVGVAGARVGARAGAAGARVGARAGAAGVRAGAAAARSGAAGVGRRGGAIAGSLRGRVDRRAENDPGRAAPDDHAAGDDA